MTIVFNLLCKALIAILDILLLDFYLKNVYPDIYKEKFKSKVVYIYPIIIICILLVNDIIIYNIIYFGLLLILFVILSFYKINKLELTKKIFLFYILVITVQIIVIFIFSWIFNTKIFSFYSNYSTTYSILIHIITNYVCFIIIIKNINEYKHQLLKHFKMLSIVLFIVFSIIFILNNPALFQTINIARTYIFTIVISIIALICFDRMQTKYEKDKHLQESIIQNLEKEKEFNQQREQQQKEIRKINHNLNNILIILQSHLEKEEYEEAKDYIEQNLKTHVEAYQALTHTGIAAIDGALNAHIQSIKEKDIQYDEDISKILHLGSIVPGDLALIISLALDNAKEACENIDGEKHISLKLQSKQTHVILYIENSIPEGSHPTFHKTSKKDKIAHGFGVSSIKEMAERYHGEAKYEVKHDQVILRVVLQK